VKNILNWVGLELKGLSEVHGLPAVPAIYHRQINWKSLGRWRLLATYDVGLEQAL